MIYCLEAWPHVSEAVFRFINVCTYTCTCDILLGDLTPCIWGSVSALLMYAYTMSYVIYCLEAWSHVSEAVFRIINVCIIYAYVIYCLETWPHVSEPVFCFINVCTYMHMWYIAWRHDPMYLSLCFVLLMYAHIPACVIYCLDAWPHVSEAVFRIINVCTYTCTCDTLLGDLTPCIWGSVSVY